MTCPSGEAEEIESEVADAATAARTIAELDKELAILADLTEVARRVRHSGTDKKWTELRDLLTDNTLIRPAEKIIIFTEHRDTLDYLAGRIRDLLGRPDAVVTIHGGVRREERRKIMELFTQDVDTRVLVATDAAGEGLNLQRAHLMVNYDLPWNPNRIEQRFGRIHRIGQTEVCHLWNLVAGDTREGMVFTQLLGKIEEQRKAYQGKVFDVLGEAFEGQPLRDLLIEAIRYGNQPEVRARLHEVIDKTVGEGLDKLIAERAAHADIFAAADLEKWRARMDEARARRLQPHYIRAFFMAAFKLLGGRISERESGRYEIRHVPADIRDRDRQTGLGAPVLTKYERVTFDKELTRPVGKPKADLLAPGHPLLDAVTDLIIERYGTLLKQGTMLVDRHDPAETPRLLVAVTHEITDGHDPARTITKRFGFAEIIPRADGTAPAPDGVRAAGEARYLDYEPLHDPERAVATPLRDAPWLSAGVETHRPGLGRHRRHARGTGPHPRAGHRPGRPGPPPGQAAPHRRDQLLGHAPRRPAGPAVRGPPPQDEARDRLRPRPRPGTPPGEAPRRPGPRRGADRPAAGHLRLARWSSPRACSTSCSAAPRTRHASPATPRCPNAAPSTPSWPPNAASAASPRKCRITIRATTSAPAPPKATGYSSRSRAVSWEPRTSGSPRPRPCTGKNAGTLSRLALVSVHPDGPERDVVRYIVDPFRDVDFGDFAATGIIGNWMKEWERGGDPI